MAKNTLLLVIKLTMKIKGSDVRYIPLLLVLKSTMKAQRSRVKQFFITNYNVNHDSTRELSHIILYY